ncbi:hypothetical protein AAMO2058_001400500 [Amorphochlora amoebiformis]
MMTFLAASLTLALALAELSPVDDEDSCHIDPEGFCVTEGPGEGFGEGGEKMIEGESGQFRFDILRRIGSQPTNGSNFVYDTAGVLEEETVKQLMNVSATIFVNKSLSVIWLTIDALPKGTSHRRFARKFLEHVFSDPHVDDSSVKDTKATADRKKRLNRAVKKAALLTLQLNRGIVTPYAGSRYKSKLSMAGLKRAVRKGKKQIKNAMYQEGMYRISNVLYRDSFRKRSVWDTIRKMGSLIIPGLALFYFLKRKGNTIESEMRGGAAGLRAGAGRLKSFMNAKGAAMSRANRRRAAYSTVLHNLSRAREDALRTVDSASSDGKYDRHKGNYDRPERPPQGKHEKKS